jgi:hypothetical protein
VSEDLPIEISDLDYVADLRTDLKVIAAGNVMSME